ncbi:hypothetical protein JCM11641_005705 [Rhodosporidiobolus odoratus]
MDDSPPPLEQPNASSPALPRPSSSLNPATVPFSPAPPPPKLFEVAQDEEDDAECLICYDHAATWGMLDCCAHPFCYDCITTWQKEGRNEMNRPEADVTLAELMAKEKCPACRREYTVVVPTPKLLAEGSEKDEAIKVYRAGLAKITCYDLLSSPLELPYCPRGRDCLYSHTHFLTSYRYDFTHTHAEHFTALERLDHEAQAQHFMLALLQTGGAMAAALLPTVPLMRESTREIISELTDLVREGEIERFRARLVELGSMKEWIRSATNRVWVGEGEEPPLQGTAEDVGDGESWLEDDEEEGEGEEEGEDWQTDDGEEEEEEEGGDSDGSVSTINEFTDSEDYNLEDMPSGQASRLPTPPDLTFRPSDRTSSRSRYIYDPEEEVYHPAPLSSEEEEDDLPSLEPIDASDSEADDLPPLEAMDSVGNVVDSEDTTTNTSRFTSPVHPEADSDPLPPPFYSNGSELVALSPPVSFSLSTAVQGVLHHLRAFTHFSSSASAPALSPSIASLPLSSVRPPPLSVFRTASLGLGLVTSALPPPSSSASLPPPRPTSPRPRPRSRPSAPSSHQLSQSASTAGNQRIPRAGFFGSHSRGSTNQSHSQSQRADEVDRLAELYQRVTGLRYGDGMEVASEEEEEEEEEAEEGLSGESGEESDGEEDGSNEEEFEDLPGLEEMDVNTDSSEGEGDSNDDDDYDPEEGSSSSGSEEDAYRISPASLPHPPPPPTSRPSALQSSSFSFPSADQASNTASAAAPRDAQQRERDRRRKRAADAAERRRAEEKWEEMN